MAEITAITPQVKDKDRCNIYVDGRFYCGLKLETALAHRLKAGQQVDLAELDAIQAENETSQALDKAMTHLSASMKTEKQVRDYLKKKGYVDAVCDQVLEKLRGYGFVDDAEYCAQYIRSAGKDKGARLIALELKKRGATVRLNTNGQANMIHKRDVTAELAEAVDKINVSLNEATAEEYVKLCKPAFGEAAFEGLQDFAKRCAARGIDTWFSVVDVIGEEKIAKCREIAKSCGVALRVREYIADSE